MDFYSFPVPVKSEILVSAVCKGGQRGNRFDELNLLRQLNRKWEKLAVNLEKRRIFSREEGEDLRSWKNLQKTRRKKQSSYFGYRCGACRRLFDA
ncbi:unnamed protein product [Prunus armeniaca]